MSSPAVAEQTEVDIPLYVKKEVGELLRMAQRPGNLGVAGLAKLDKDSSQIGMCCGSYVLTVGEDNSVPLHGVPYPAFFDGLKGYDEEELKRHIETAYRNSNYEVFMRDLYGEHWRTRFLTRNSTRLLFIRDVEAERAKELFYSEEFKKEFPVDGYTINDEDDGVISFVWADK